MEELTCPNCNVDTDREELKHNNLHCPTCGFDMSETEDPEDLADADANLAAADEDKEDLEDKEEKE